MFIRFIIITAVQVSFYYNLLYIINYIYYKYILFILYYILYVILLYVIYYTQFKITSRFADSRTRIFILNSKHNFEMTNNNLKATDYAMYHHVYKKILIFECITYSCVSYLSAYSDFCPTQI
jgi:hypothetical protein